MILRLWCWWHWFFGPRHDAAPLPVSRPRGHIRHAPPPTSECPPFAGLVMPETAHIGRFEHARMLNGDLAMILHIRIEKTGKEFNLVFCRNRVLNLQNRLRGLVRELVQAQ